MASRRRVKRSSATSPGCITSSHGARTPRIALITQWFPPEPVGTATNIYDTLNANFNTLALTGYPNYPAGEIYSGYSNRGVSLTSTNGRRAVRTPLYPYHGRSTFKRILNYLSWAASSTLLGWRAATQADINFVYSSPATAATVAIAARILARKPYILMVQDVWPDTVFATGFLQSRFTRRVAERMINAFNWVAYRLASRVIVISPGMTDLLESRGVAREKIELVHNWADEQIYRPAPRGTDRLPGLRVEAGIDQESFVVLYAGNIGDAQHLDIAIEAMDALRDYSDLHLVMIGDGVALETLRKKVLDINLDNVHFLPWRAPQDVVPLLWQANIGLASLSSQPIFRVTTPGKVASLLASAMPLIVHGDGDIANIVQASQSGFVCPSGDRESLVDAFRKAYHLTEHELAAYGSRGREHYVTMMSEQVSRKRIIQIIEST